VILRFQPLLTDLLYGLAAFLNFRFFATGAFADLSVDVPEHNVNRPNAGNHVRQQLPFDDAGQRLQIYK